MPIKIFRHTIVRDEIIETTTTWKDVSETVVEIMPDPIPAPTPAPTPVLTPTRTTILKTDWSEANPPLSDFTMTGRTGVSLSRAISLNNVHNQVNSDRARADVIPFEGRKVVRLRVLSDPGVSTAIRLALIQGNADYSVLKAYAGKTVVGEYQVRWPARPEFGPSGSWLGTAQTKGDDTMGKPTTWMAYETNGIGVHADGTPKVLHQIGFDPGVNVQMAISARPIWPLNEWATVRVKIVQDKAAPRIEYFLNGVLLVRFTGALLTADGYAKVYPLMLYSDDWAASKPVEVLFGDVEFWAE